jgi:hypothetical protein
MALKIPDNLHIVFQNIGYCILEKVFPVHHIAFYISFSCCMHYSIMDKLFVLFAKTFLNVLIINNLTPRIPVDGKRLTAASPRYDSPIFLKEHSGGFWITTQKAGNYFLFFILIRAVSSHFLPNLLSLNLHDTLAFVLLARSFWMVIILLLWKSKSCQ